jgi:hypothetical protein
MKRSYFTLLALLAFLVASAQGGQVARHIETLKAQGAAFTPVALVKAFPEDDHTRNLWAATCARAEVVKLDAAATSRLLQAPPATMSITFPSPDGPVTLDLEHRDPFASGFTLETASRGAVPLPVGAHYRGCVQGDPHSVAGLSIFGDELMAIISDVHGTLVIGRLKHADEGVHIIYREQDLLMRNPMTCDVQDDGVTLHPEDLQDNGERTLRCVKFYWEVDYPIFQAKGSVAAATNYVTGLFNQSAILYANDGVDVQLQEVFVWDVASPYSGPSTGDFLDQFGAYRTSFNGDLAHLLGSSGGGGIAWLNTLCSGTQFRMAYSMVYNSYSNVPTYSWSVEVVTHEQGHNMGSPHTHACAWNGNNTAIDGCGPTAGHSEGCTAPLPTGGGTIMSYCHLVSGVGINFNNGFGPQPAALIRNHVNAATCLDACGSTCDPPDPLNVVSLTSISGTLTWSNIGAASYTLRWKPQASGTWTTIPGLTATSYGLTGLTQSTTYQAQVMSDCGTSSSAFGDTLTFTTPVPCPDSLESNDTFATAAAVGLPANINALIATAADQDYYGFSITATSSVYVSLYGLPGDYDMELLDALGSQIAVSQNGGTSSEYINQSGLAAGDYVVHVYGYSGANSPVVCYGLSMFAQAPYCMAPQSLNATGITYDGAVLGWNAVQGAISYDVQWKESSSSTWNLEEGIGGTSTPLTGLAWNTAYTFQVRSTCEGVGSANGGSSGWSEPAFFTTLAPPCEVSPPTAVRAKVLLDGAWRSDAQLMVDSLRRQGLLPLQEPYSGLGFTVSEAAATTAPVLAVTGADAITDWVLLELRSSSTPSQVLETRAALVQRDGDIVGVDGVSAVGFCQDSGYYYVAVRHRNHLGAMTAAPVLLGRTPVPLDFSATATPTWGTNARKQADGRALLWSGNVERDTEVKYTGSANDRDPILIAIGSALPTNTIAGYWPADVTLDGVVKYTGAGNDKDPILVNIGGSITTNTVEEQLP